MLYTFPWLSLSSVSSATEAFTVVGVPCKALMAYVASLRRAVDDEVGEQMKGQRWR